MQLGISLTLNRSVPRGSAVVSAAEAEEPPPVEDAPPDSSVYSDLVIPLPGAAAAASSSLASSKRSRPSENDERPPSKRPLLMSSSRSGKDGDASQGQQTAEDIAVTSEAYRRIPVSAFGAAMLRGMGVRVDAEGRAEGSAAGVGSSQAAVMHRSRAAGTAYLGLGATTQASEALAAKKGALPAILKPPPSQSTSASLVSSRYPWLRMHELVWVLPRSSASPPTLDMPTVPPQGCLGVVKAIDGVPGLEQCIVRVRACDVPGQAAVMRDKPTLILVHPKRNTRAVEGGETGGGGELLREHARAENEEEAALVAADSATVETSAGGGASVPAGAASTHEPLHAQALEGSSATAPSAPASSSISSSWLWPGIRVRVIDEEWEGGRWWKCKGVVHDVSGMGLADVLLEREGAAAVLRTGVKAGQLCTALPKVGGRVRILRGSHRGGLAMLLARDSGGGQAQIRVLRTDDIVTVPLDDVAEAVST